MTGLQNLTFFMHIRQKFSQNLLISPNLGQWIQINNWFLSIMSEFRSLANFMVAWCQNQFLALAFCKKKTMGDIENLKTNKRFKIKFCAIEKKKKLKKWHFLYYWFWKFCSWGILPFWMFSPWGESRRTENVFTRLFIYLIPTDILNR